MKPTVFQVNQPDGMVRLICVYLPTMRNALDLQNLFQEKLTRNYVQLLGRFERIQMATSMQEAIAIAFETQCTRRQIWPDHLRLFCSMPKNS
jgi:hypothetical protein